MTGRRGAALLIALMLGVVEAGAQVNVEAMRDFEVEGVGASLSGDVAVQAGNSDLVEVGVGTRIDVRHGRHYSFFVGSARYGTAEGQTFQNRTFAHLRYNYQLVPRLVGEVFGQAERDGFTLLQLRLLGGAGLRGRLVQGAHGGVFPGTTLMIEYEDLDAARVVRHPAETRGLRWSTYVNVRLRLADKVTFINTVYVQPLLADFGDVRVLDEAALAVSLTRHVTLRTTFNLRYDRGPPDDVEPLDLAVRNGVVVRL